MKALTGPTSRRARRNGASTRAVCVPVSDGKSPIRIASILVPIDFSAPSINALDYALHLALACEASVSLIHVIEVAATPDFASFPLFLGSERTRTIRKELSELAEEHGCTGSRLGRIRVCSGVPFREITKIAESSKVGMIVMATHGYTGLKHVLLGSTAERVVRQAPCPVLVVPARS